MNGNMQFSIAMLRILGGLCPLPVHGCTNFLGFPLVQSRPHSVHNTISPYASAACGPWGQC
eukprot:9865175-Karenia_brevis.AAC.1